MKVFMWLEKGKSLGGGDTMKERHGVCVSIGNEIVIHMAWLLWGSWRRSHTVQQGALKASGRCRWVVSGQMTVTWLPGHSPVYFLPHHLYSATTRQGTTERLPKTHISELMNTTST
jgi:hypothetical protein